MNLTYHNAQLRTNGGTPEEFVVNVKNELTHSTPTGAQSYDAKGNLITREGGWWTSLYEEEHRLVCIPTWATGCYTVLAYDGLSRLRLRQEVLYWAPPDPESEALEALLGRVRPDDPTWAGQPFASET